ncbi:acetyltransferase [Psychrosphaera aestuarii]|uniref:acetyltransferase n=1 Tax=Psychrosphaera aestuarii TaxID=1266052 RepID=UPI001FD37DFF|nr:acetyltransferase [Psychrosphaera aestuarii]
MLGASGHGKVVADIAESCGFQVTFFDDRYPEMKGIEHWTVNGNTADLIRVKNQFDCAFVAIGDNTIRAAKQAVLQTHGLISTSLIHPSAVVSRYAQIDHGTVVFPGAIINSFSKIGAGCIINSNSVIEHDCNLGKFCHISPNVALGGGTRIGSKSWIGIGSVTKQLIEIGESVVIGAGSTVVSNVPNYVIAYGTPTKIIKAVDS